MTIRSFVKQGVVFFLVLGKIRFYYASLHEINLDLAFMIIVSPTRVGNSGFLITGK